MCDLRNAPVAVVPSHALDVIDRWLGLAAVVLDMVVTWSPR